MKRNIYNLLFEDAEIRKSPEGSVKIQGDVGVKSRMSDSSLDDQIDSLIMKYEQDAIKEDEIGGGSLYESLRSKNLKYLFEQEEPIEDEEEEPPGAEGEEAPAEGETTTDEPSGSDSVDPGVSGASSDIVPNLDVDVFTKKIARLLTNHRNLLRVEDVIINRAKNFLDENYGDAFVTKFIDTLDSQFGIEVSDTNKADMFPDDEQAPNAVGSGGSSAGGA